MFVPQTGRTPLRERPYHLVVIGAGTAGLVTAAGAAGLGARVALVERELMGGDCLNVGCVPSKGVIRAARVAATVRDAASFGVNIDGEAKVDFGKAMQRMRRLRSKISPNDSAERFSQLGVDVFFGQGRFVDDRTITVTRGDGSVSELKFRKAVIATGARASAPPILGLDTVAYLTNESLFSLTELPKRFGVVGTGPIGAEMAQSFARFGSEVFLFGRGAHLLPREDADAAEIIARQFERDGIRSDAAKRGHAAPSGRGWDDPRERQAERRTMRNRGRQTACRGRSCAEHRRPESRSRQRQVRCAGCRSRRPSADDQSADLCRRRYLLEVQVHARGRFPGPRS